MLISPLGSATRGTTKNKSAADDDGHAATGAESVVEGSAATTPPIVGRPNPGELLELSLKDRLLKNRAN